MKFLKTILCVVGDAQKLLKHLGIVVRKFFGQA